MEDSAKRRERLQAMRTEASRAAASPYSSPASAPVPLPLPLPLLSEPPVPLPGGLESPPPPAPRFEFYSDPMSTFSAAKRMRGVGTGAAGFSPSSPYLPHPPTPPPPPPQSTFPSGIRNTYMDSSYASVQQFHMSQPPDSSSYGTPSHVPYNSPWRSPVRSPTPFSGYRGSPACGPGSWNRSSGSGFPTYSSNSVPRSPHFGPVESPRSIAFSNSPQSITGRGRGRQFCGGPSPRPSGGRGRSFSGKASAREDIERYYLKSMIENPWHDLEPVVGNILEPMAGQGYWLPESISGKKSEVSETEKRNQFSSKSSLAEFLAASLEEAVNDD
ncbi:leucine-rich repeat extensin-like protein 5 [Musa acuminata AAA Group]|uniref:leucine-rich repeat extensin-like protein 5 n=1 Tax=Musa acuminata AAA Group TaxID=214697 RepID=UPI0031DB1BDA